MIIKGNCSLQVEVNSSSCSGLLNVWQNALLLKLPGYESICITNCWRSREYWQSNAISLYYCFVLPWVFSIHHCQKEDVWLYHKCLVCPAVAVSRRVFLDIHENFKQHQKWWNFRQVHFYFHKHFKIVRCPSCWIFLYKE